MPLVHVKPAEGRTVLEPRTRFVMPPEGMKVDDHDPHWMAHVRFGDVVIVEDVPPEAESKPEPATDNAAPAADAAH